MSNDQIPPRNEAAERKVLSAMLQDNRRIPDASVLLIEDDFHSFVNQQVFKLMIALDARGKPAGIDDVLTAADVAGVADDVTAPFLAGLYEETSAISEVALAHYATELRGQRIKRNVIEASRQSAAQAFDPTEDPDETLASAERRFLAIAEKGARVATRHVSETIKETWAAIDERRARGGSLSGIATGLVDFDAKTAGLQKSSLVIVGARPSCGKTAFAVNVARHVVLEERVPVLFVSLEQSRIELTERLLCCHAQVDSHRLRTECLSPAEAERLQLAGELLTRAPFYIDDTGNQTLLQLAANARLMKRRHGVGLIIIDYLQLIDDTGKKENRQEQVAANSRRLKLLARELKIPVMVLAQLNRQSESRSDPRPKLSDLRESGALEQDADVVALLHRSDSKDRGQHDGLVDLIVAKHRNGPTGDAKLIYIKQHMRFENYSVEKIGHGT